MLLADEVGWDATSSEAAPLYQHRNDFGRLLAGQSTAREKRPLGRVHKEASMVNTLITKIDQAKSITM